MNEIRNQLSSDIAKRKLVENKLRESEEKYRGLFDSSPDLIFITDRKTGTITNVNKSACELLGYSKDELVGTVSGSRIVSSQKDNYKQQLEVLKKTGRYSGEFDIRKKDGSLLSVEVIGAAFGGYLHAIGRDITKRKLAEKELTKYRAHLEHLVKERTKELEHARKRAENSDRLKSAFLANMSHELRTPLNSIIGFTGIVLEGLSGPLNDEQRYQLGMAQDSARHLLNLLNGILDLSKIEADQMTISSETVNVRSIIDTAINTVLPLANAKGLPLTADISENVGQFLTDPLRLEQIIINLLSNAIKFTETGSIIIECLAEKTHLSISVKDTGMGIKEEDINTLFSPFQQLDNSMTRRHDGTGLGLSICKKLVTLMGGIIKVKSQWGAGSTFTFKLPLKTMEESP